jgi:hypothetical protein
MDCGCNNLRDSAGVQIYGKNKNGKFYGAGKLPVNWSLSATANKDKNSVLE